MESPTVAPAPDVAHAQATSAPRDPFLDALRAAGPDRALGDVAAAYDWLIGSWEGDVVDYDPDGTRHRSRGEWHFAWVLEGRAVQDVWIVPSRGDRTNPPGPRNRYGTTVRVHDARTGDWRITWFNPVTGVETRLTGRRSGGR